MFDCFWLLNGFLKIYNEARNLYHNSRCQKQKGYLMCLGKSTHDQECQSLPQICSSLSCNQVEKQLCSMVLYNQYS